MLLLRGWLPPGNVAMSPDMPTVTEGLQVAAVLCQQRLQLPVLLLLLLLLLYTSHFGRHVLHAVHSGGTLNPPPCRPPCILHQEHTCWSNGASKRRPAERASRSMFFSGLHVQDSMVPCQRTVLTELLAVAKLGCTAHVQGGGPGAL
jgi:hypothetical protein